MGRSAAGRRCRPSSSPAQETLRAPRHFARRTFPWTRGPRYAWSSMWATGTARWRSIRRDNPGIRRARIFATYFRFGREVLTCRCFTPELPSKKPPARFYRCDRKTARGVVGSPMQIRRYRLASRSATLAGRRGCEMKRSALTDFGISPDGPIVAPDDALHGRQPDAGPREFRLGMQTLKYPEQLRCERHVEARAVVPDEIAGFTPLGPGAKFNGGVRAIGGEFPSVAQQVLQDDLHQGRIGIDDHASFDVKRDVPTGLAIPKMRRHLVRQCR